MPGNVRLFTVFWAHPWHGDGSFQIMATTAEAAGTDAAEMLSEDLADDEGDALETATICDDLDVKVWEGKFTSRPEGAPAYIFR